MDQDDRKRTLTARHIVSTKWVTCSPLSRFETLVIHCPELGASHPHVHVCVAYTYTGDAAEKAHEAAVRFVRGLETKAAVTSFERATSRAIRTGLKIAKVSK